MTSKFLKLERQGFRHGTSDHQCPEFFYSMSELGLCAMREFGYKVEKNTDKCAVDCFFPDGKSCEIKVDFRAGCDLPGKPHTGNLFIEVVSFGKPSRSIIDNSDYLAEIFEHDGYTYVGLIERSKFDYKNYPLHKVEYLGTEGHLVPVVEYLTMCDPDNIRCLPCTPPI